MSKCLEYLHSKKFVQFNNNWQRATKWKDKPQTEDEKNLAQPDFTTTFFVNQTPAEVFNAINNVSGWWQGEIEGNTNKLNDEFTYRMKDLHFSKQQVIELFQTKK